MNKNTPLRNPFTYRIPKIKLAEKKLKSPKFFATLLIITMLVGTSFLSIAISQLTAEVVVGSSGTISPYLAASSGSAADIQAAVDECASLGTGLVYIPEGTFNFVEPGEPWTTVLIPAGVSLFGAPTERTSGLQEPAQGMSPNDQVVEWKTVLVQPNEVASTDYTTEAWFIIEGTGNPNEFSRFSDIKFSGYRDIDNSSPYTTRAIIVRNVAEFRIDHNYFGHTPSGVFIGGDADANVKGVLDHNYFVNIYGMADLMVADSTVHYGVGMWRSGSTYWESNLEGLLGSYGDYSIYIEDNYFRRWRHSTAANHGQHYVFRHNTIQYSGGVGEIDAHGNYWNIGTRAMEIYNNVIVDPVDSQDKPFNQWDGGAGKQVYGRALLWRGGGGVVFNNYIRNYRWIGELKAEDYYPQNHDPNIIVTPNDFWIWNNVYDQCGPQYFSTSVSPVNEEEHYWLGGTSYWPSPQPNTYPLELPKPGSGEPSISYTPYVYPHPLTQVP